MTRSERISALMQLGALFGLAEELADLEANLSPLGCSCIFERMPDYDDEDPSALPFFWAQVDHPERVAIFQGPASALSAWCHGLDWGLFLASRGVRA